jgi:hypothetical protein
VARFWFPNFGNNFLEHFQQSTLRKFQAPWPSHPTFPMGPERNLAAGKFDPLRARRRPGRVSITPRFPYRLVFLLLVYLLSLTL